MRAVITVKQGRRQGQTYVCSVSAPKIEYWETDMRAGNSPEEAAAAAMDCAARWGRDGYVVLGAPEVLRLIPADIRQS